MKKFLGLFLVLIMLFIASAGLADDLAIKIIGGENTAMEAVSLDDLQLGTAYTIDGYAVISPKEFIIADCFAQFGKDGNYGVHQAASLSHPEKEPSIVYSYADSKFNKEQWRYSDAHWIDSGKTAEFLWFIIDITNLQKVDIEFIEQATVKVVYNDDYEFGGWVRQINYDNLEDVYSNGGISRFNQEKGTYPMTIVMHPETVAPVAMMYSSSYVFGCTLPNYVIEDKDSPLRIEIQLGNNDLTHHIRK